MRIVTCDKYNWQRIFASKNGPSSDGVRLVLHTLALHMSKEGENAFPSQETIAEESDLSIRSVKSNLAKAVAGGWIFRFARPGRKAHAHIQHQYTATIPEKFNGLWEAPPWELDPTWERQHVSVSEARTVLARHGANSAERHGANSAGAVSAEVAESPPHGANPAEVGANSAPQGANSVATGCKSSSDMVHGLHPINALSNALSNAENNPRNVLQQAAAPRGPETLDGKSSKAEEPEAAAQSDAEKWQSQQAMIAKAIGAQPEWGDADIAKMLPRDITAPMVKAARKAMRRNPAMVH